MLPGSRCSILCTRPRVAELTFKATILADPWPYHSALMAPPLTPPVLQVLKQPVQETDALSPHWKVKKWIGHILNRLLSKYGNPRGLKKHEQQLGQAFIDAYAMKFLEGWMTLCSWYRAKQYVSPQPLALALNYMDTAMDFKPTYEIVRGNLDVLMFEVLFPMLCFTEADAEMWQDNPQEYIRKLYDPIGDLYNPRLSASNLLLKLSYPTKIFHAKDCLNRFLVFITNQLNKYQADAQKDFQAKDGCLFAIGSLRRRLRLNDEYKDHMEPLIQVLCVCVCVCVPGRF